MKCQVKTGAGDCTGNWGGQGLMARERGAVRAGFFTKAWPFKMSQGTVAQPGRKKVDLSGNVQALSVTFKQKKRYVRDRRYNYAARPGGKKL